VVSVVETVDKAKHELKELKPLFSEEDEYKNNRLQMFINKVVLYTDLRA